MNQDVTYDDHLLFLDRQIEGAIWERRGFGDARSVMAVVPPDNPYHAMRYKQGLAEGQIKLMQDKLMVDESFPATHLLHKGAV
jgi:hypothetical protein